MLKADQVLIQKSMTAPIDLKMASEKQVLYVNDSNNSSYNGSITIDSTVLSNSGRYLDWSEALIEVPIAITLESSENIDNLPYLVGLKSGHFQLIDSIQVDIQNKNIVQSQSYTNFHTSYRVLSSWSQDDVKKYGDLTGVNPDSDSHFGLLPTATPSRQGHGVINNIGFWIAKGFAIADPKDAFNEGFGRRVENIAQNSTGTAGVTSSAAILKNSGTSYFVKDTINKSHWYVIATIRLKDVCDVFAQMPLLKGTQVRFTINYNAVRIAGSCPGTGATADLTTTVTMLNGRSSPVMLTSNESGQPWASLRADSATFTLEYNVKNTSLGGSNPLLNSARLYVPAYALLPEVEMNYLKMSPVKEIVYNDIYQYTIQSVNANDPFNQLLTNAIVNPQRLTIIPMLTRTDTASGGMEQFQSPYSSAPFTAFPQASITQLQVLLSGRSVFDQPINYTFEQFMYEASKTGFMGGVETGVCSGLISKAGFEGNYPFITIDLSRRAPEEDIVPKSIQLLGVNNTSYAITYYCFVEYRRSMSIELATGRVL